MISQVVKSIIVGFISLYIGIKVLYVDENLTLTIFSDN